MFACVNVLAGSDFSIETYGISHVHFLKAAVRHSQFLHFSGTEQRAGTIEILALLPCLERHGLESIVDGKQKEESYEEWVGAGCDMVEMQRHLNKPFVSEYAIGSRDVRRFVANQLKLFQELIQPSETIMHQGCRGKDILFSTGLTLPTTIYPLRLSESVIQHLDLELMKPCFCKSKKISMRLQKI